ncbi:deubiquitinase OTUD6B-like [Argiope bruennichi]|uniref:deubiquitinase OTUD6B-like n=1 Tax=Argiope bruennichi TaxID=94029 RepID=UPI0024940F51|nr:deubiquitinase OTUD6B-like [Argiope bruennichi]
MAECLTLEDILTQQKKEKKELLAKTQKMKHGIPKGDKKKKKEVTAEIAQLISDLDIRHDEELKEFQAKTASGNLPELHDVCENLNRASVQHEENSENLCDNSFEDSRFLGASQKLSKAQKRRNKKSLKEKEREKAIAEQELENLTGNRFIESKEIAKKLSERQLIIHEVPSDGNCLYAAIEHQLSALNLEKLTVESLRELTSKYLLSHKEEYLPFLTDPDTGDILSDEQYVKYCEDIRNTTAWGGQIEIQALSKICGKPIEVIQAEGPSIIAGDETSSPKLIISYHRHAYGLGEHYNSVVPSG